MEESKKIEKKNTKGITLIALVITIIVLLILAGVSIGMLTGENGILTKAQQAKEETEQSTLEEEVDLQVLAKEMANRSEEGTKDLGYYLRQINGATVEELASDVWYVTRGNAEVTVYDDGSVVTGKVNIWDGTSIEVPEFKDFNWYIYNGAQMKFFADFVNNANALTEEQKILVAQEGYNESDITITEDTTVYLMADIDLGARQTDGTLTSGTAWTPIGTTNDLKFIGTFEGNNHTISGVYIDRTESYAGIFGISNTIKNLTIKDSYIKGANGTGGIVGVLRMGTIENCHNINTTIILREGNYYAVGGIVGQNLSGTQLVSCSNAGAITAYGSVDSNGNNFSYCGGIVGYNYGVIENCSNSGAVTGQGVGIGGVVGGSRPSANVRNCSNTGIITGQRMCIGGIVGILGGTIEECYNEGTVTGNNGRVGGIVGETNSLGTVINCNNTGAVTGKEEGVGGVIGILYGTIEECYNEGTVIHKSSGTGLGGICGEIGANRASTIQNCYNKGKIIEEASNVEGVGGIIGWVSENGTSGTISNNYNVGEIEIKGQNVTSIGGVIGRITTVGANAFTRNNNYYSEGTYRTDGNNEGESKTSAEMKTQSFVDLLNTGLSESIWKIVTGKNDGYPTFDM